MTTSIPTQYGPLSFPLADQATAASLLAPCDPVVDRLSAFLMVFIDADLGNALTGALADAAPPVTENVADLLTLDPRADHTDPKQVRFPLLCVYKKSSTLSQLSLAEQQKVSTLGVDYILPAMTLDQAKKYAHVRSAVEASVDRALSIGFHPDYNGGQRVIGTDDGIVEAKLVKATYATHPFGEITAFYALFCEIEVTETEVFIDDDLPSYDGASLHVGEGNYDGLFENFVDADTEQPA